MGDNSGTEISKINALQIELGFGVHVPGSIAKEMEVTRATPSFPSEVMASS